MIATLNLCSNKKGELNKFLSHYYDTNIELANNLSWGKEYKNPIELAEIIGAFVDNSDDYLLIKMWICLDKDIFINVTEQNANDIIKYLYERFPY